MSDGYPDAPVEPNGHPEPAEADPRVGAAVRRLDELSDRALAEHVEVFESVHRGLQESLAEAAGDAEPAQQDPRGADPRSDR